MSIMAKFRRVTRYGVAVFLAAAACFSGFAVDCNVYYDEELDVWWWECGGQLEGPWAPGEGGGSGNCTNCVQTSPAECESIKASVSGIADQINQTVSSSRSTIDGIRGKVQEVRNTLKTITDEGDQFEYFDSYPSTPANNVLQFSSVPQSSYFSAPTPTGTLASQYAFPQFQQLSLGSSANSIYNYYNQSVNPQLGTLDTQLTEIGFGLDWLSGDLNTYEASANNLNALAGAMNCSACSSGSSGSGGGGSGSGGCPCADAIREVRTVAENIYAEVVKIPLKLQEWDKFIKQIKTIADAVGPIGTNFVHAVALTDLDGTAINMAELDKLLHDQSTGAFDQGEYAKLSWFTRVEYLLGQIAGVFSVTNRDEDLEEDTITDAYDSILSDKDSLSSSVNQVKNQFSNIHTSFNGFFSSFRSAYSGLGSSATTITLCSSWFGGRGLTFQVDGSVRQVARTISSLIWTLNFTFLAYNILIYGIKYFAFVFKLWLSQITQFVK